MKLERTRKKADVPDDGAKHDAEATELALKIRSLARLLLEFNLCEIELERNGERLKIRRPDFTPSVHAMPPTAAPPAASAEVLHPTVYITSPFVGTFYRSPSPETASFVELGQQIKKGQVLCIIEAMKLMNEIEAEVSGTVVTCLAENGQSVEYGEPLFQIRP